MKILALETDIRKLNESFLLRDEELILQVRFHGLVFFLRTLVATFFTLLIIAAGMAVVNFGMPGGFVMLALFIIWTIGVARPLLRAFIDWKCDELVVTNEKIVIVNQSSIIRQEIIQMNLENLASVRVCTQYWGLFPFGTLCFELKEGTGKSVQLGYIPRAQRVCSVISDVLVRFQQR